MSPVYNFEDAKQSEVLRNEYEYWTFVKSCGRDNYIGPSNVAASIAPERYPCVALIVPSQEIFDDAATEDNTKFVYFEGQEVEPIASAPKATPEQLAISENQTREHIATVQLYMRRFAFALLERAEVHDQSKLAEPEASAFALANAGEFLKGTTYGSEEYKERIKTHLGPALAHHYANNSHHPEFHENGINQMDLLDLVEMFIDHIAACERHQDGCPYKSLEINTERFGYSPQLKSIFKNSLDSLD